MNVQEAIEFDIKRFGLDTSVSGGIHSGDELIIKYSYQFKGSEREVLKKLISHLVESLETLAKIGIE